MKGVILESKKDWVIVMTNEGDFLKVKKAPEYKDIGQTITLKKQNDFNFKDSLNKLGIKMHLKQLVVLCTMMFLILTPLLNHFNNRAYAYMMIDINPSIQLTIDNDLKVIDIKPFNKDGENVLQSIGNWKRESEYTVTKKIIRSSRNKGFLKKNNVYVSIDYLKNKKSEVLEGSLNKVKKEEGISLIQLYPTKEQWRKAKELNVSVNKYQLYEKSKAIKNQTKTKQLNEKTMKELIKESNKNKDKHTQTNKSDENQRHEQVKEQKTNNKQINSQKSENGETKTKSEITSNKKAIKDEKNNGKQNSANSTTINKSNTQNKITTPKKNTETQNKNDNKQVKNQQYKDKQIHRNK